MMNERVLRQLGAWAAAAALLSACGGGGGGTDGTGAAQPAALVFSSGAMVKGSVILNGIRFDDTQATVVDDRNRSAAQLGTGMVVRVRGRSDDNASGTAERVKVENEVRAAITAIDPNAVPQRFTVGGLSVLVDSDTVFANVPGNAGIAGLSTGTRVEVHGLRDATNQLRATRVEVVGAAGPAEGLDELRGTVAGLNTATDRFTLNNGITVSYASATFRPAGANEASLANGGVVEVHGSLANGVFTATLVDIENLGDDGFRGAAGDKQESEGFVTGFTTHPGAFKVNGVNVRTTATTRFQGGTSADLIDGVKVEAEGAVDAQGVLVASKIEFKRTRVLLQGLATAVDATAGTVQVLNQTVRANTLTRISARTSGGNSAALSGIAAGIDCVEVRGFVDNGQIVAEEITEPSGCGRDLVQARVSAENEGTAVLTFFNGLNASLPSTAQYRDRSETLINRAQFLAAVTPAGASQAGTLVKVKGRFSGGTLAVEEAELED